MSGGEAERRAPSRQAEDHHGERCHFWNRARRRSVTCPPLCRFLDLGEGLGETLISIGELNRTGEAAPGTPPQKRTLRARSLQSTQELGFLFRSKLKWLVILTQYHNDGGAGRGFHPLQDTRNFSSRDSDLHNRLATKRSVVGTAGMGGA